MVAMHPVVCLTIFVDDATLSAEHDDLAACVDAVASVAEQLAAVVGGELGGDLVLDKAAAIGSSPAVVAILRRRLGVYAGGRSIHVVSLGVDVGVGRARRRAHVRGKGGDAQPGGNGQDA